MTPSLPFPLPSLTFGNRPSLIRAVPHSSVVSGRRPFAKDEAEELGLDYECESEWDWEEPDPEDVEECLSEGGDPEEDAAAGAGSDAEDADGFYVPDGYLSADEGGGSRLEEGGDADKAEEGDMMEVDSVAAPSAPEDDEGRNDSVVRGTMELRRLQARDPPPPPPPLQLRAALWHCVSAGKPSPVVPSLRLRLQVQLHKAKRAGKAVVVHRTSGSEVPWQLSALRMQAKPPPPPFPPGPVASSLLIVRPLPPPSPPSPLPLNSPSCPPLLHPLLCPLPPGPSPPLAVPSSSARFGTEPKQDLRPLLSPKRFLSGRDGQVFPGAVEPIVPVKASATGAPATGGSEAQTPADAARKTPRGRGPHTFPDELLPELLRFLVDNPALPINKVRCPSPCPPPPSLSPCLLP